MSVWSIFSVPTTAQWGGCYSPFSDEEEGELERVSDLVGQQDLVQVLLCSGLGASYGLASFTKVINKNLNKHRSR